jgi:hypothetical protein
VRFGDGTNSANQQLLVLPEWFGAIADGLTDCLPALNACVNSLYNWGGTIKLGKGSYRITGQWKIVSRDPGIYPINVKGEGKRNVTVYADFTSGDYGIYVGDPIKRTAGHNFEGFRLDGKWDNSSAVVYGLYIENPYMCKIDIQVQNFTTGTGLVLAANGMISGYSTITDLIISNCKNGLGLIGNSTNEYYVDENLITKPCIILKDSSDGTGIRIAPGRTNMIFRPSITMNTNTHAADTSRAVSIEAVGACTSYLNTVQGGVWEMINTGIYVDNSCPLNNFIANVQSDGCINAFYSVSAFNNLVVGSYGSLALQCLPQNDKNDATGGAISLYSFDTLRRAYLGTTLSGATKEVALGIPGGVVIRAVQINVTQAITGAATWDADFYGGSTTKIAHNASPDQWTRVDNVLVPEKTTGWTSLRFRATGSKFTGGVVDIFVYYDRLRHPGQIVNP